MKKHIAILHTTAATISGMKALCEELLPGVETCHYMHDGLLPRINRAGGITEDVRQEIAMLVALAAKSGPGAIMSACSTIGEAVEDLRPAYEMPLLRVDEPMGRQAAAFEGPVTVCAALPSTLGPTLRLIERYRQNGLPVEHRVISGAGRLLAQGKREKYLDLIAGELADMAKGGGLVVLAQASMAEALSRVPPDIRGSFLTSPRAGVAALKAYCEQEESK